MEDNKKKEKQVQTERGLIYVVGEYNNLFDAQKDGYSYYFTSSRLGCDVYGKYIGGYSHEFVLIKGNRNMMPEMVKEGK